MSLPVAGYYRVSRARDEMRAPELYAEQITSYCSYRKLTLAKIYSDIDASGYNQARNNRPALSALIEARHNYTAGVVPTLSRFTALSSSSTSCPASAEFVGLKPPNGFCFF